MKDEMVARGKKILTNRKIGIKKGVEILSEIRRENKVKLKRIIFKRKLGKESEESIKISMAIRDRKGRKRS